MQQVLADVGAGPGSEYRGGGIHLGNSKARGDCFMDETKEQSTPATVTKLTVKSETIVGTAGTSSLAPCPHLL